MNLNAFLNLNINGFTNGLRQASQAAQQFSNNFGANIRQLEKDSRAADGGLGNIAKSIRGIAAATGLAMVAGQVYEIGKACIQAEIAMQALEIQFKSVFGSAEAGERRFSAISSFVDKYGLDLQTTAEAYTKFMAASKLGTMTMMEAEEAFKGVSIGIAGLHLNADKASRIFIQLQQMMSKGIVQAEELRVVAESLPGAYGLVAEALGKTGKEMADLMRKGELDSTKTIKALGEQLKKMYGGAALEASVMLQASINRFNKKLFETKVILGQQLAPTFQFVLGQLGYLLEGIQMYVKWVQKAAAYTAYFYTVANQNKDGSSTSMFQKLIRWANPVIGFAEKVRAVADKISKRGSTNYDILQEQLKEIEKNSKLNGGGWTDKEIDAELARVKKLHDEIAKYLDGKGDEKAAKKAANAIKSAIKQIEQFEISSEKAFNKKNLSGYDEAVQKAKDSFESLKTSVGDIGSKGVVALRLIAAEIKAVDNAARGFFAEQFENIDKSIEDIGFNIQKMDISKVLTPGANSLQIRLQEIKAEVAEAFREIDKAEKHMNKKERQRADATRKALEAAKVREAATKSYNDTLKSLVDKIANADREANFLKETFTDNEFEAGLKSIGSTLRTEFESIINEIEKAGFSVDALRESLANLETSSKNLKVSQSLKSIYDNAQKELNSTNQQNKDANTFNPITGNKAGFMGLFNKDLVKQQRAVNYDKIHGEVFNPDKQGELDAMYKQATDSFMSTGDTTGLSQYDATISKLYELEDAKMQAADTEMFQSMTSDIQGAFENMTGALGDAFAKFAETGKMNLSDLAASLHKTLVMYAAQKTAILLMTAAYEGVMGLVASAGNQQEQAKKHYAAAASAIVGAAIMGSFVAGAGLANMAHKGITDVPEDGTWLLQKNERVVDAKTNQDLKQFLKEGGGGKAVTFGDININGGDEQGVMRALPKLRETILDVVNSDIAGNGRTRNTVMQYASAR